MGIKILLEEGPKPRNGAGGIVLANMEDVERARGLGWGWKEISKELGVESPQAVRKAYVRIKKQIDSGKLKLKPSAVGESAERKANVGEKKGRIPKEEKKEVPGPDQAAPSGGVKLVEGKMKNGACDLFNSFKSID